MNTNRKLFILASTIVVLVALFAAFGEDSVNWWFLGLAFILGGWTWVDTMVTIDVGYRGAPLFLGERTGEAEWPEGWNWIPWPWGVVVVDCKEVVEKLDHLKVITIDNVRVEIDGSVIRRIVNLNKYLSVDRASIKQGLDDTWDQVIRSEVAGMPLIGDTTATPPTTSVLKMHVELGDSVYAGVKKYALDSWGIEVIRVLVAGIAVDETIAKEMALKEAEKLQKEAQKIEFQHFIERVQELIAAGLSREQAVEHAQLALGKITKNVDAKTIAIDSATAEALAKIFGRRP